MRHRHDDLLENPETNGQRADFESAMTRPCDPVGAVPTILVSVYTDGMGTYQARCLQCAHRGPWRRTEATAVEDAKTHQEHAA